MMAGAALGLGAATFDYYDAASGIAREPGTWLVIVSMAVLLAAAAALPFAPRMLRRLLRAGLLLGIAGTGFAGWLLESRAIVAAVVIVLAGWILEVASSVRHASAPIRA